MFGVTNANLHIKFDVKLGLKVAKKEKILLICKQCRSR